MFLFYSTIDFYLQYLSIIVNIVFSTFIFFKSMTISVVTCKLSLLVPLSLDKKSASFPG